MVNEPVQETFTLVSQFNKESRRQNGHTLRTAIKDVIDNHVDSGYAKENINYNKIQMFLAEDKFRTGKKVLITTDFGYGMFSNRLSEMYQDGFSSKRNCEENINNEIGYLGKYGNGQKNAVNRLSTGVITLSKVEGENIYAVDYNLDVLDIQGTNPNIDRYKVVQGQSNKTDIYLQYWKEFMVDNLGDMVMHGTMNIFYGIKDENLRLLEKAFLPPKHFDSRNFFSIIGESYYKIINDKLKIFIGNSYANMTEVEPLNPFAGSVMVEQKDFKIPTSVNGITKFFDVSVKFHQFSRINTAFRKTSVDYSGLYFFRENRLHFDSHDKPMQVDLPIKAIEKIDGKKSEGIWLSTGGTRGRLRVEINFPAMLDSVFNVNQNKTNIHFEDSPELTDLSIYLYKKSRELADKMTKQQNQIRNASLSDPDTFKNRQTKLAQVNPNFYQTKVNEVLTKYDTHPEYLLVKEIIDLYNKNIGVVI